MIVPSARLPALIATLVAAGCSCPNNPLDPLPELEDTNPLTSDSETTNPWDSDDVPDDTEPQGPTEGANLLMNSGFEQGEGDYTGVGYGWETNDGAVHGENWFDYHSLCGHGRPVHLGQLERCGHPSALSRRLRRAR